MGNIPVSVICVFPGAEYPAPAGRYLFMRTPANRKEAPLTRLESLVLLLTWCSCLSSFGSLTGAHLKRFGAALVGLSLMMNAHADDGRSSGRSSDAGSRMEAGISRFVFDGWSGPELRVWTYVPSSVTADARILFVMHGVERDAKRYIADWARTAERYGVILVAPEFDERRFPGPESYNQGGVIDPRTGKTRDPETWTFSVIEPLFDEVKRRTRSEVRAYSIYGHSAGAQFVHRFVMLAHPVRLDHAVAANAGWYTWFDPDRAFPQGMKLHRQGFALDRSGFSERLTILLGTEDIESDDRNLRDDVWTREQGQNRLERGRAFFAHARETAGARAPAFRWRLQYAPGVAHENRKMTLYAGDILFRKDAPEKRPEILLALHRNEGADVCEELKWPNSKHFNLAKATCGGVADVRMDTWAALPGSMQQSESVALLDQALLVDDKVELPQRLARSVKIALIDAEGKDPRESSRLERTVDDVVRRGADLVLLVNSPTDGRVRKADGYTLFHLPRQKSRRQDRDAGRKRTAVATLIAMAPDASKQAIAIRVYPSWAGAAGRDSAQWSPFVETVRRIVARTRDKVRFEAGQDELGDYLTFEIDWPRSQ